jgi:glycosyltransferase EpsF
MEILLENNLRKLYEISSRSKVEDSHYYTWESEMKVLFVVKNMRLSNGVASYAMNYYRKLNGEELQFDFLIISDVGSPYYAEIENNGNKVFLMPSYKKKPLEVVPYLKKIFKENNYDILHCNVMNSGSIVLMLAKKYRIPVRILHSHATQTGDKKWKEIRNKLFCGMSLNFANTYFSCSHLAGDYLFGKDNYYLIPNAIEVEKYSFNMEKRRFHREMEKCEDKLVLITVGRFTKQKNPLFIVDIVRALSCLNNNFVLWWFGNGELEKTVTQYAKENRVDKFIKFWGASSAVNEYYSAADIFILPSLYEGLPVVGIEAQVSALPALLSNKITAETKISNPVEFLPITDADLWAKRILYYASFDRENNVKSLNLGAYKIEEQAEKLKTTYTSLLEEKNRNVKK